MTFTENGHDMSDLASKDLPELKCELTKIGNERIALCETVENKLSGIPPQAVRYLAENCPKPELMSAVLSEIRLLLAESPTSLDDLNMLGPLVDGCITNAQIKEVKNKTHDVIEGNELHETKNGVLENIARQTTNLKGRAKLAAAREYLSNPDIPATTRSALLARFDQIENTLASMSAVFTDPASQSEFDRIVSATSFDLGAPDLATTFAPIIEQVETNKLFTAEQKYKLREIVTGSDAQNSLTETITDQNGNSMPRFTADNKREFRQGVSGYVEGHNRQIIETCAGDRMITKDVTGWSGEDVGLLIEVTHFSVLGDGNAFDPIQITHLRQVLSHLTGSFESYDGDIAILSEHKTLIQNQSRLLSETQTALGLENDRSGITKVLRRIGLEDEKGNPNLEVIKSFGDYTKRYYGNGAPDQLRLVEYLYRLHPDLVKPLSGEEKAKGKLSSVREV